MSKDAPRGYGIHQVVLKANQVVVQLQDAELAISVTPKRIDATLGSIAKRLKPNLIELYAEDYSSEGHDGARNGMEILESLRSIEKKLASLLPLVEALHANELDNESLRAAFDKVAEIGIALPAALALQVWWRLCKLKFETQDFDAWVASLFFLHGDAPEQLEALPPGAVSEFREKHIVECAVKLIQGEGMHETLRLMLTKLQDFAPMLTSESLREDISNLTKLVNVQAAPLDQVEGIFTLKKRMLEGANVYTSRFGRGLKLFPTGAAICVAIDKDCNELRTLASYLLFLF